MRILFVDDMQSRHDSFIAQIDELYPNDFDDLYCVHKAFVALHLAKEYQYDIMFLDHDLADIHYKEGTGEFTENNEISGTEIARVVSELPLEMRPKLVVIHSWNNAGVNRMASVLVSADIKVVISRFSCNLLEDVSIHINQVIKDLARQI